MFESIRLLALVLVIFAEILRVNKERRELSGRDGRMGHLITIVFFASPTYYSLELAHIVRLF